MNKIAIAAAIMSGSYSTEYMYSTSDDQNPTGVKLQGEGNATIELDIDSYNTLDKLMNPNGIALVEAVEDYDYRDRNSLETHIGM